MILFVYPLAVEKKKKKKKVTSTIKVRVRRIYKQPIDLSPTLKASRKNATREESKPQAKPKQTSFDRDVSRNR